MALTAITRVDGTQNYPGAKLKITITTLDNVTTFPAMDTTPSTDVEYTTLVGDFVLTAPAVQWEFEPSTGMIESEQVGSHNKCTYTGKLFMPSSAMGTAVKANLVKGIDSRIIAKIPLQNGSTIICGETPDRPGTIKLQKFSSLKEGEDGKVSADVEIVWYSQVPGGALMTGALPIV